MAEEEGAGEAAEQEGGRLGKRQQEINYTQSAALLLHIFCPFTVFKGFHGDARPAGAACGEEGKHVGEL